MLVAGHFSERILMSFKCQKVILFGKFEVNFHVSTPLLGKIYQLEFYQFIYK